MNISDERIIPLSQVIGMQEIIRGFNKSYSKIIGFTINSDYSQNEIYQICALMHLTVINYGNQNYRLNECLNSLKYYLMNDTKPCNDTDEFNASLILDRISDLNTNRPE